MRNSIGNLLMLSFIIIQIPVNGAVFTKFAISEAFEDSEQLPIRAYTYYLKRGNS